MASRSNSSEDKHTHMFVVDQCQCGIYRLPRPVFESRVVAWEKYYADCRNTESAQTFQLQREAYRKGDMGAVKEFARQAKERLQKQDYLPKPTFFEPREVFVESTDNLVYCK